MHEKLRALYDNALRAYPGLEADACFALAWGSLSLSDRAQVRDEESGEWQRQQEEAARLRESSMRAAGRGERANKMNDERVGIFLKAVRGVLEDPEITKAEREDVLADVFDDYAARTGRDGLADISSLPTPASEPIVMNALTRQELALELLKAKAAELRKVKPELSESQAFAKAYEANGELAQIERVASRAIFEEQATAQHGGGLEKNLALAKRDAAYAALQMKGEELRRADPLLTREGAIAKAMKLYPDLAARERQASRAALYA